MRIVLDTASLITALRSETGAAAEVVDMILRGDIVLLMDYKLGLEYCDVALRPKHLSVSSRSLEETQELIESLEVFAEPVLIVRKDRPLSSDPNDDMVLDVAINGNAEVLVTMNRKHFVPTCKRFGISVLSPAEFLETLKKGRKNVN